MAKILILIIIILFIFAYFYFGYYQDYKRNPKEFTRTIIGMPLGITANMFGLKNIEQKIKDWTNVEEHKKEKDNFE